MSFRILGSYVTRGGGGVGFNALVCLNQDALDAPILDSRLSWQLSSEHRIDIRYYNLILAPAYEKTMGGGGGRRPINLR